MKLSILIVNWNTKDLVIRCVNSLLENAPKFDYEVVVVDNASFDGSLVALREEFGENPKVKIIDAKQNLGFARGSNLAYKHSIGEYVFLLNPDTEVKTGAIQGLVEYLEQNLRVGIVGPKLLSPDGSRQESVRRFPDLWSSILFFSGLHRLVRPKKYLMTGFDYNSEAEVDQIMGAALMTRKSIIEKLGLFDEKFYLWYEEVDFCYRVKRDSLKVMYYPRAEVMHRTAQSFSQLRVFKRKKTVAKSLIYYFKKNGSWFDVAVLSIVMIPILALAWLTNLFGVKSNIKVS